MAGSGAIKAAGIPVVVTLHNYWHVCPQVDLIYNEHGFDYEGGRRCTGCLNESKPGVRKVKTHRQTHRRTLARAETGRAISKSRRLIRKALNGEEATGIVQRQPKPDREFRDGA